MTGTTARHRAEYLAYRVARGVAAGVPEEPALTLGAAFGRALGSAVRFRRADVDRHLGWAFPDAPEPWRRRVARASYAHFGREAAVLLRADAWTPEALRARTRLVGFDLFREAVAAGRGVVLLTGHLGNWEMGGAAIAAQGVPLDVVGKGMSNARFQEDLFATRARLGMRVIEMGEASREALRGLAAGRVVAMLADQQAHKGGVLVPFFGRPASTARGPAVFALRTGAPVFVAFCVAEGGRTARYVLTFDRLEVPPTAGADADVIALLSAYGASLERAIRGVPEQYFWQHRRWKNAPQPHPGNPPELPSAD
ncbi:MAG: lysophospholipid acyltransferase family protein [Longimicrobiales bacterium]